MSARMHGKVAVVTGAASGIGEAIARRLLGEGARVVLADVDADRGAEVATELGADGFFVQADVTREQDWEKLVSVTAERFAPVNVLVNNAGGAAGVKSILDEEYDAHKRLLDLNITSVWLGMRAGLRAMATNGGGSIVNISSIDGIVGVAGMTTYAGTKFAVTGMTKSVALEAGAYGVRVNSVHPGITATPLVLNKSDAVLARMAAATRDQPLPRMGNPEEVANAVLYFASDESSYSTGTSLVVDGGHIAGPPRTSIN